MSVRFTKSAESLPWVMLCAALMLAGCNSVNPGGPGNASFVATTPSASGGTPEGIAKVNATAFSDTTITHAVFAHPDDEQRLRDAVKAEDLRVTELGPYRGLHWRAGTLFD